MRREALLIELGWRTELKRRWKDGTTHVVMTPEVLIERLLAFVPRPRRHLVTYHGVLAPASGLRSRTR